MAGGGHLLEPQLPALTHTWAVGVMYGGVAPVYEKARSSSAGVMAQVARTVGHDSESRGA